MKTLIIGGTRNVGYLLALALREAGHSVTLLNRGITRDDLPTDIERLRADRTDPLQMRSALSDRTFDAAIDTTLYNAEEAEAIVKLLRGKVGHYLFLSSGQVYLVREGIERPFREIDYEGRLLPAPKAETYAYEEWLYGMNKRRAEEVFFQASREQHFPATLLRLPMVNGERDHYHRIYNYLLRLRDGGPILVPTTPNFPLRHVYSADVVAAIQRLIETGAGKGKAYNIAQDETLTLDEFLALLSSILGVSHRIVRINRALLEANGFLPDCSPFSERWMSSLDNQVSKTELQLRYTPLPAYLERIVGHYLRQKPPRPHAYRRRKAEIKLAESVAAGGN